MINKNDALILKCIMELNHCDMVSAMDFAENHVSDYHLAMVVAQAKDEEFKAEKQALIDKACEWLRNNIESDKYLSPDEESYRMGCGVDYLETNMFIEDFKNYSCGLIERNGR